MKDSSKYVKSMAANVYMYYREEWVDFKFLKIIKSKSKMITLLGFKNNNYM